MWVLKNIATGDLMESPVKPEWVAGIWECRDFRITDAIGDRYTVIPPVAGSPKVSPAEFKLLFTSAERVAIRQARATDATVDDFFDLVEDPRLTTVDLALPSVQGALRYLAATGLITDARIVEILKGGVQ